MHLFNVLAKCTNENYACIGIIGESGIPGDLVRIIHYIYLAIQVVVPIILIIFGMIELAKSLASQKEDEIKKAQGSLFRKLILAVLVFLVFSIVRLVFNFATSDNEDAESVWSCVSQLINGDCGNSGDSDASNVSFNFTCSGDEGSYDAEFRQGTLVVSYKMKEYSSASAAQQAAAHYNYNVSASGTQYTKEGKEISYLAKGNQLFEITTFYKEYFPDNIKYNNRNKLMEWYAKQNGLVCK